MGYITGYQLWSIEDLQLLHLFCHYVNISYIIFDDADIHMTCLATHASCVTFK